MVTLLRQIFVLLVYCVLHASAGSRYSVPHFRLGGSLDDKDAGIKKTHIGAGSRRTSTNRGAIDGASTILLIRGGSQYKKRNVNSNMTKALLEIALSTALETAGLLGVMKLGELLPLFRVCGLPMFQWCSTGLVIFSSKTIKLWVEQIVGAARNQMLRLRRREKCIAGGAGSSKATTNQEQSAITNTTKKKKKPSQKWALVGIWWSISKPMQLLAASKILLQTPLQYWPALAVYCTHLSLVDTWKDLFFLHHQQRLGLAVIAISISSICLVKSTKLFWDRSPMAGKLMVPTCGWIFMATWLNVSLLYR